MSSYDVVIVGAGTAGMPAAVEAASLGMRVLVLEASERAGGTLWRSWAQMSAAGTSLQAAKGIKDNPQLHFDDVMRISKGTADPVLVRKAVEHAPSTIEWLLQRDFDMDPAAPAVLHFHEPYSLPRTYWGRRGGRSVLEVLLPAFEAAARAADVTVEFGARIEGLDLDSSGRVEGVRYRHGGGTVQECSAGAVLLTTGGYAGNPDLFPELTQGAPLAGPAAPTSTGSGILVAQEAGARVRGEELFLPTYGGVLEPESAWQTVHLDDYPVLTPQARPPWEIHVNVHGQRFVAEDAASVDVRENALLRQPGLVFWIVFDEDTRKNAPALFPSWTSDALEQAWASHPSFSTADDLRDLAQHAGIDPDGLVATVAEWNDSVVTGHDPLGRRSLQGLVSSPPFYAVRNHGTALKSPAGLQVDDQLRVLSTTGVIDNLFAAGEVIGGSSLSGKSFVSGMSVTPALAFGRLAVRTVAGADTTPGSL
jgi:fumarate reductase flavoprotein subunit